MRNRAFSVAAKLGLAPAVAGVMAYAPLQPDTLEAHMPAAKAAAGTDYAKVQLLQTK